MNLIWIVCDTLRADRLGCYGSQVRTPYLDRFAERSILFEEAHAEGLPTGPERLVWLTGKFTLPFRGWEPLQPKEPTLPGVLNAAGYVSAMITDTNNITRATCNYQRDFSVYELIRGQEADRYISAPVGDPPELYLKPDSDQIPLEHKQKGEGYLDSLRQYLQNVAYRQTEEDHFVAQVTRRAMQWLEDNAAHDQFFLWVDCFDPHEPWDAPDYYVQMYADPDYDGPDLIAPWYHSLFAKDFTPAELDHIRALYAAEVTLVDYWVGQLLEKIEHMGLLGDTLVVFTSDHGTNLGERGHVTKCPRAGNTLCRGLCRVPLIVHHPDGPSGARVPQLVWSPDLTPTVLDQLGVAAPESMHGRSYWPVVHGQEAAARDYTVTGWRSHEWYYVRHDRWALVREVPQDRSELYALDADPAESSDVAGQHPDVVAALEAKLVEFFDEARSLSP